MRWLLIILVVCSTTLVKAAHIHEGVGRHNETKAPEWGLSEPSKRINCSLDDFNEIQRKVTTALENELETLLLSRSRKVSRMISHDRHEYVRVAQRDLDGLLKTRARANPVEGDGLAGTKADILSSKLACLSLRNEDKINLRRLVETTVNQVLDDVKRERQRKIVEEDQSPLRSLELDLTHTNHDHGLSQ